MTREQVYLTEEQKGRYDQLTSAIAKIKNAHSNNPDMDLRVLDDYATQSLQIADKINKKQDALIRANTPPKEIQQQLAALEKNENDRWVKSAKSKYGLKGEAAFAALNDEGRGVIGGITKNFYDKNDGGWQMGGVIGAGIGALAMFLFGGQLGLGGGWMGIIGMVGAALLGGFLGNKAGDLISGIGKDKSSSQQHTQGYGQSQQLSGDALKRHENAAALAEKLERDKKIAELPAETKAAAAATGVAIKAFTGMDPNIDVLQFAEASNVQPTPGAKSNTEQKR